MKGDAVHLNIHASLARGTVIWISNVVEGLFVVIIIVAQNSFGVQQIVARVS